MPKREEIYEAMKSYEKEYFNLIRCGLDKLAVTNDKGDSVTADQGVEILAGKVREIQKETKGLIFFCGNGASASMAEHMSHDWFQNAQVNTTTCAEISHITAISNDLSYSDVYSYRVKRILSDKDLFIGISSSGNSENIVKAIKAARENGAFTVSVSGKTEENKIRSMGHLNFYVPLDRYGEVECAHSVLLHSMLDYFLDKYMGGRH